MNIKQALITEEDKDTENKLYNAHPVYETGKSTIFSEEKNTMEISMDPTNRRNNYVSSLSRAISDYFEGRINSMDDYRNAFDIIRDSIQRIEKDNDIERKELLLAQAKEIEKKIAKLLAINISLQSLNFNQDFQKIKDLADKMIRGEISGDLEKTVELSNAIATIEIIMKNYGKNPTSLDVKQCNEICEIFAETQELFKEYVEEIKALIEPLNTEGYDDTVINDLLNNHPKFVIGSIANNINLNTLIENFKEIGEVQKDLKDIKSKLNYSLEEIITEETKEYKKEVSENPQIPTQDLEIQ